MLRASGSKLLKSSAAGLLWPAQLCGHQRSALDYYAAGESMITPVESPGMGLAVHCKFPLPPPHTQESSLAQWRLRDSDMSLGYTGTASGPMAASQCGGAVHWGLTSGP
jgi:hypothetical protein